MNKQQRENYNRLTNKLTLMGVRFYDVGVLIKAERTLHRWFELECGDGNDYASWAIERDEETDAPYMVRYPHDGKSYRNRIPDREAGARKRIAKICADAGLHFYVQGDPRGCALYIAKEPLSDSDYNRGVAVYIG